MKHKALFLDRDGTIIEHVHHLVKIEDVKLIAPMFEVMKQAQEHGFLLIIVTNQSVVGRGYITEENLACIHEYIIAEFKKMHIHINAVYYCPHHPDNAMNDYKKECECRKPKPGLIIKAAQDNNIDLPSSIMVGDNISDIKAGENAGCRTFLIENNNYKDLLAMLN